MGGNTFRMRDNKRQKPAFGYAKMFGGNRDCSKNQSLDDPDIQPQDGYTLHPQQVLETLIWVLIVLVPCPGDEDTPVHDSCMLTML